MKKYLKFFTFFLLSTFLAHLLFFTFDGFKKPKKRNDIALIFGNKIEENGIPSKRLQARLDEGIKLYRKQRVKKIIVSGGLGKEGFWEGTEMKKYLINNNVKNVDIIIDNYGNNTEKSVQNSLKIMDSLNYKSLVSVSQFYHQSRIKLIFRKKRFDNFETSSPKYFELRDFYSLFREFFAYYHFLLFG